MLTQLELRPFAPTDYKTLARLACAVSSEQLKFEKQPAWIGYCKDLKETL